MVRDQPPAGYFPLLPMALYILIMVSIDRYKVS